MRLEATDIAKRFGRRYIFRGLDLLVDEPGSVAITGPNGSGKSTLLRVLAGLMSPTRGGVRLQVNGRDIDAARRPLSIGFVAPYLQFYDAFSARENLMFVAGARSLSAAAPRVDGVLSRVGLSGVAERALSAYSSGMIQRVRIASALLARPRIMMMDEPYSNLDRVGRELVDEILAEHVSDGGAYLLATNSADEAASCDRSLDVSRFTGTHR